MTRLRVFTLLVFLLFLTAYTNAHPTADAPTPAFTQVPDQAAKTVEGGRYLQPFAKIMLALAARREMQNALAQKLLHESTEEFPESRLNPAEYAKAIGRPIPATMRP